MQTDNDEFWACKATIVEFVDEIIKRIEGGLPMNTGTITALGIQQVQYLEKLYEVNPHSYKRWDTIDLERILPVKPLSLVVDNARAS